MIYTVTLNPAIDYVVGLNGSLKPGEINRTTREEIQYGGKGINVSNMLRTLGHDSVALGFVAGFTGRELERGLAEMGLKTRFIHVKEGMTRINVKIKADEETEINGIGPEIRPEDVEELHAILEKLTREDILVLSGSIPSGLWPDFYDILLSRALRRGAQTVVDTSGFALFNAVWHEPFLIKPNRRELEELCLKKLNTDEEIIECAWMFKDRGAKNVLVSMDADGALLLDEYGVVHRIRCPKGTVVNSVGAGDSMVAGFLAGYLETGDYDYALKLGTAAGSATAFSLGLGDRETIRDLMSKL